MPRRKTNSTPDTQDFQDEKSAKPQVAPEFRGLGFRAESLGFRGFRVEGLGA